MDARDLAKLDERIVTIDERVRRLELVAVRLETIVERLEKPAPTVELAPARPKLVRDGTLTAIGGSVGAAVAALIQHLTK
jgi:hypothetical protein